MEKQIRRVGLIIVALFVAVFLQLNYVQIYAAERIAKNPANVLNLIREYSIKRGDILTRDGKVMAESRSTHGKLKYVRVYPAGDLYGHITGYVSVGSGAHFGLENTYDNDLLGEGGVLSMQQIQDRLLGGGHEGDDIQTTIDSRLQAAAKQALGNNRGAIVALDPRSGDVRALWSYPSYDPSGIASHDSAEAERAYQALHPTSPTSPLIDIATSNRYPPGSTFKVVTAGAALESGKYTTKSTFSDPLALDLPLTNNTLQNFSHSTCAGGGQIDMFTALTVSCDTTFALLGLKIPADIYDMANRLYFNKTIPFDLSDVASKYPNVPDKNAPLRAYSAIGQGNTAATPLQMALVAATVANGGVVPEPHLLHEIIDPSGGLVKRFDATPDLGRAMSPETASDLTEMMKAVVEKGTGTNAQIPGVAVAGKTGTAQTVTGTNPHTWFICFAPADDPKIAVAVIVEHGGTYGSEATGGLVAAPIAKQILEADRQIDGW
ncbi:MAG: penicillin-binding transpeptidase domain-containing protein [Actinomycetota bacterium]|nr:penicillin-binding transpeptidase domain-containing protein [Actinomycetota bacterium]